MKIDNRNILLSLLSFLWLILSANFANAEEKTSVPTKIAIIGDSKTFGKQMDLLTAELTGNSQISLIERSEIDKILSEQKIGLKNLFDPESSVKTGKLSKASIFVVLSGIKDLKK
jgi:hypothetical protein